MKGFKKGFANEVLTIKYKKTIFLILILIVVTAGFSFFDGWLSDITAPDIPVNTEPSFVATLSHPPSCPVITLYETGKYYEIYKVDYYDTGYLYYVFDKNHKAFSYEIVPIKPTLTMSDGLIKRCTNASIGIVNCRYFNINNKYASELFHNPIAENKSLIVHLDYSIGATTLIVQDIFDKSKYYREFKRDFSSRQNPVTSADFINGDKKLRITYWTGADKHEVTETLDLY